MGDPFDLVIARERRADLLRETEERRIAGASRRARRGVGGSVSSCEAARGDRRRPSKGRWPKAQWSFGVGSVPFIRMPREQS